MDEARFSGFRNYDSDVFASFVADLWERAGYDCSLVDARLGEPNVVARRHGGGTIHMVVLVGDNTDFSTLADAGVDELVDVVVVTQPTTASELDISSDVELFDAERLAALVEELDASELVDDYLLGRTTARERTRERRRRRDRGETNRRSTAAEQPTDAHRESAHEATATDATESEVNDTNGGGPDLTRGRAFTLVTVGVVGLCLGTAIGESVGGLLEVIVLNGAYLLLLVGIVFDARSLDFTGFRGGWGIALGLFLGWLLLVGIVSPLLAALAGGIYLVRRLLVERAHTPDGGAAPSWTPLGRHPWYWAVVAGTVGWPVAFLGAVSPVQFGAGTVIVGLGSWIVTPLGLVFHGRQRAQPPSRRLIVLGVVPYLGALAGLVYVYRQERGDGAELDDSVRRGDSSEDSAGVARRLGRRFGRSLATVSAGLRTVRARGGTDATEQADRDGDDGTTPDADADERNQHRGGPTGGGGSPHVDSGASSETVDGEPTWSVDDLGPPVRRPPRESRTIRHDGVDFRCTSIASRNGRWRVAWGTAKGDDARERVFLLQYEARHATVDTVSVSECAVGEDGTVAIVESDGEAVSRLRVLTPSGTTVFDRGFDGGVRCIAVGNDGERPLVGVGVRSPTRLVVVDGRTGDEVLTASVTADPAAAEFREGAGDQWLVVGSETQPAPNAAVRVRDGELIQ